MRCATNRIERQPKALRRVIRMRGGEALPAEEPVLLYGRRLGSPLDKLDLRVKKIGPGTMHPFGDKTEPSRDAPYHDAGSAPGRNRGGNGCG